MLFLTYLQFSLLLRRVISPFLELCLPYSDLLKQRFAFEMLNLQDKRSLPFRGESATFCFEVASDGEFEQVLPIISLALERKQRIELIYSSPSVEKRIEQFQDTSLIRVLRLPLLTAEMGNFKINEWVSAEHIYLCRYDFFPELLMQGLLCKSRGGDFGLIWASLKNKDFLFQSGFSFKKWFYRNIFLSFNQFYVPLKKDEERLVKLGIDAASIHYGEFRINQIQKRISNSEKTILSLYPHMSTFMEVLKNGSFLQRIILGSAWAIDLDILNEPQLKQQIATGQTLCMIVPHDLSEENLQQMNFLLSEKLGFKVTYLAEHQSRDNFETPSVYVLNLKGVLCEFYDFFEHAYVGGGFGRSVHSLLEPFLAGNLVYCGPKVHRSTEFDVIQEIDSQRIRILSRPQDLYPSLINKVKLDTQKLDELSLIGKRSIENIVSGI